MGRILIAGTHSGCGKTTVTCALLAAIKKRGLPLSAFKCGPDYIDPMFHRKVLGIPSHNLDSFFSTPDQLREMLSADSEKTALLEGTMGYYDGAGPDGRYSTYEVACATNTPVVLVIDVKGMYASAGAILEGFLNYKPANQIQGVIFNNTSAALYHGLRSIAEKAGVKPLGFLPKEPDASLESRRLGLVSANEITEIEQKLKLLGRLAEQYIDIGALLALSAVPPILPLFKKSVLHTSKPVRIAIARDNAFCFLYEENLNLLSSIGCEPVFFSPLADRALPEEIGGLYLCGGYPELHLLALSKNTSLLTSIRRAVQSGLPTVAECGGFLYLHRTLDGYPMAGAIDVDAFRTDRLVRFGYITLQAKHDNLLCAAGETIRAHEFHYYDSSDCGGGFTAQKPLTGQSWPCIHTTQTLYAGFPHLYFNSNPAFAENFVKRAMKYAP